MNAATARRGTTRHQPPRLQSTAATLHRQLRAQRARRMLRWDARRLEIESHLAAVLPDPRRDLERLGPS